MFKVFSFFALIALAVPTLTLAAARCDANYLITLSGMNPGQVVQVVRYLQQSGAVIEKSSSHGPSVMLSVEAKTVPAQTAVQQLSNTPSVAIECDQQLIQF